jgi:hypothetical protein
MTTRRIGAASRPVRCNSAFPGCSECEGRHHKPTPDSRGQDWTAALPVQLTSDFTWPGQSHQQHAAPHDEDLHSTRRTSLTDAPRQHHHEDAPQPTTTPVVQDVCQLCEHSGGLPLGRLLVPIPRSDLFCAVTPMDDRGRLADRTPVHAAGWSPGQLITITATPDHRVIVHAGGPETITRHGHLRLPARIRHACALSAGDRLLVTVTSTPNLLTVYPMAAVEAVLRHQHAPSSTSKEAP